MSLTEEVLIKYYRQLSTLGKAKALIYLESAVVEEREIEAKKELQKLSQATRPNYIDKPVGDCKYLEWEKASPNCTNYNNRFTCIDSMGCCTVPSRNKMCPCYKIKKND